VHLCVAPLRYQLQQRERHGVASLHLAERLQVGDSVPVYVQQNTHFRLPADAATPIVMIGAGTGVAPYRAFLQQREARGERGRSWLFFGERNFRTDFLYQAEWQEWLRAGLLTRADVAFSRDQHDKIYVQHKLLQQGAELYRWIADGAHLYVCGDANGMAQDVHAALLALIAHGRGRGDDDAADYLRELQAAGRYQKDVY
ncbi:MAG: sulfite reductase [NADPH] flavoprotein alpha-component, partial [Burkholderiaceae bacterium]